MKSGARAHRDSEDVRGILPYYSIIEFLFLYEAIEL